jgi:DNA-binding CsgD family transcriptional regulator
MSPREIKRRLQSFLEGGHDASAPPWRELFDLYRVAHLLNEELFKATAASSPSDHAWLGNAIVSAQRARTDLARALRPLEKLSAWGRDYIAAQTTVPAASEARLEAIERLRESLSDYARSKYQWRQLKGGLDGLVMALLDDCEHQQRLRREAAAIPARKFGIGDRLRQWFGSRSEKLAKAEAAPDWRGRFRDDDALAALSAAENTEDAALFRMIAPDLLTEAQRETIGLKALGLSDTEIAQRLGLNPVTVRVHGRDARQRLEGFIADKCAIRPPGKL